MDVPSQQELIDTITAFRARHDDMPPTRFGIEATSDPNVVSDLLKGRSPTLAKLHRLKDYMARKDAEAGHVPSDTGADAGSSAGNDGDLSRREAADA